MLKSFFFLNIVDSLVNATGMKQIYVGYYFQKAEFCHEQKCIESQHMVFILCYWSAPCDLGTRC